MTVSDIEQSSEFEFQAEVSKLLHLMVHSVYTEKEIFLRELISNASDACDKLRYEAVTHPDLLGEEADFKITLEADPDLKTLTISDNGIGMSRQDLIDNLGTIARSGTKAFMENLASSASEEMNSDLIGQFGVGFYSAFMVADRVEVLSRKAGKEDAHLWISDGQGSYQVDQVESGEEKTRIAHGTRVTLFLNKEADVFLQAAELKRIVRTYSDHIPFPIILIDEEAETEGDAETEENQDDQNEVPVKEAQINSASALWSRPKSDITEEQYKEFYHYVAAQFDDPALTIHYKAEGRHEYSVLLFLPTHPPFDITDPGRKGRVKLYVRRVFITDDAELLPAYLRFVRGVIDSQDMPLNISREMLQNNPIVEAIRKAITNRILSELKKLASKDNETYEKIWETFGATIKEGLYEDMERRDSLYEITRFRSTAGEDWRSLKDYVAEMKDNQTAIYYLVGDALEALKTSPQIEGYKARDIEVLLLTDQIDHFWVTAVLGFDGKPFQSISQGDANLANIPLKESDKEDAPDEETPKEIATLIAALKTVLGEAVFDVKLSDRLVESAACLVAPEQGPDLGLEKILGRQSKGFGLRPILEINSNHALVKSLLPLAKDAGSDDFKDLSWLLFDEARILSGEKPSDPAQFSQRMNRFLVAGLNRSN